MNMEFMWFYYNFRFACQNVYDYFEIRSKLETFLRIDMCHFHINLILLFEIFGNDVRVELCYVMFWSDTASNRKWTYSYYLCFAAHQFLRESFRVFVYVCPKLTIGIMSKWSDAILHRHEWHLCAAVSVSTNKQTNKHG